MIQKISHEAERTIERPDSSLILLTKTDALKGRYRARLEILDKLVHVLIVHSIEVLGRPLIAHLAHPCHAAADVLSAFSRDLFA